jgi:hypothetical protein
MHIQLSLGRPHSEGDLGTLGTVTADSAGEFSSVVSLGDLGCEAAALDTLADAPGEPRELYIFASISGLLFPSGIKHAVYTYTTTTSGLATVAAALPATGHGPQASETGIPLSVLLLSLAAGGTLLIAVALAWRRNAG